MPPQKIFPQQILNTAFELAREGGMESVLIRSIADALDCSVQPIYSHFENADGLRDSVCDEVDAYVRKFIADRMAADDPLHSLAATVFALANEEPELFKIFFLRERALAFEDTLIIEPHDDSLRLYVMKTYGLSEEDSHTILHLISTYTIGACTKIALRNLRQLTAAQVDEFYFVLDSLIKNIKK